MAGSKATSGSDEPNQKRPARDLEARVESLLRRRVARNLNALRGEERRTTGEFMADTMTKAVGSWPFIFSFLAILGVWMAVNVVAGVRHWDPYPFMLLNMVLSCVAAIQAPIILMSQNREASRDRTRAEADYQVDVKVEILLEHLTQEVEVLKVMLAERRQGTAG